MNARRTFHEFSYSDPFLDVSWDCAGREDYHVVDMTRDTDAPPPRAPSRRELGPIVVDERLSTGEVAFAVLRKQFSLLLELRPAVIAGDDPENLHDLRVSIRRLRAALAIFSDAMPSDAADFRSELRWVGSALGAARDLDVLMAQLRKWSEPAPSPAREALETLLVDLEDRRAQADTTLVRTLRSRRMELLIQRFTRVVVAGPSPRAFASAPVVDAAPRIVTHAFRRVVSLGEDATVDSPPQTLHALRIRCKRLRYAVEFFAPIYGKPATAYARRVAGVQGILGEHQDAIVAIDVLRSIATRRDREVPAATLFEAGRAAERYAGIARDARAALPKKYRVITKKRWSALRHSMNEHRKVKRAVLSVVAEGRQA